MILTATEKKILDYIRSRGWQRFTWQNFREALEQCHALPDSDEKIRIMLRGLIHGGVLNSNEHQWYVPPSLEEVTALQKAIRHGDALTLKYDMNRAEFELVLETEDDLLRNYPSDAVEYWFMADRHLCSRRLYADDMEGFLEFMRTHGHERQAACDALNELMQEGKIYLEFANPPKQTIGLYYSP